MEHKGVDLVKSGKYKGKYNARVTDNYKRKSLGMYDTYEEAHQAYLDYRELNVVNRKMKNDKHTY